MAYILPNCKHTGYTLNNLEQTVTGYYLDAAKAAMECQKLPTYRTGMLQVLREHPGRGQGSGDACGHTLGESEASHTLHLM